MSGERTQPAGPQAGERFGPELIASLDEPVRRYLTHAIRDGTPLSPRMRLAMAGRIKIGTWLPFSAEEECDALCFVWRATVGPARLRALTVVDSFDRGVGKTEGGLFGRLRLFRADDADTSRSAAGRAGAEGLVLAPSSSLTAQVKWRAENESSVVAAWRVPPEDLAVRLAIAHDGSLRSLSFLRWGDTGQGGHGYIPFGVEFSGERQFGDYTLPSRFRAGWWFGTPRYAPFFEAQIGSAVPVP
jgi:hypothetical protein